MFRFRIMTGALGLLAAGALALTACSGGGNAVAGPGQDDSTEQIIDRDGTFRYVYVQNPLSFDPQRSPSAWDMIWLRLAYDQLIWQNEAGDLEPMLATQWEFVTDGLALEMTLREDVNFIDGEHLDAEAVRANIERAMTMDESVHKANLERIDSVEVIEPYKIRIHLNGPGGNLPALFSSNVGSMISPAAFDNPDLDQNPVGTGMAKLVDYIPGQVSRFERNEDYWDPEVAQAKFYEIYVQTASPTRMNMLTSGQGELTYLLPQDEEAARSTGLHVEPSISSTIFSLRLHAGKKGLDDPRVREALEHSINRQALIDGVFFGAGIPVTQHVPPGNWAYHPDITPENERFTHDPELARELLDEAGHSEGIDLEMIIPGLDDHRALGEALVPMLAEGGFNVTTRVVEATNVGVTFSIDLQGELTPAAQPPITDPTNNYQRNLPGQYYNPFDNTSDGFIEAWNESLIGNTQEERLPGVHRMIETETHLRNVIPLFLFTPPSVWTDNVVFPDGYTPSYAPHFRGVGVTAN